jgi:hypothetical protein
VANLKFTYEEPTVAQCWAAQGPFKTLLSRPSCSLLRRQRTFRFSRANHLTRLMGGCIEPCSDRCADNRRENK